MIDAKRLLDDLKRLLRRLEDDLRERSGMDDALHDTLQREYQTAREAGRTGEAFEVWREGMLTQAAVAWLLGCVFVRFMEDNGLVDEPLLSGSHERRQQAAERQMGYFRQRPTDSDRDYLYDVFRTVAQLPAVATLFDAQHHPVWVYGISGDAAKELIGFWRQVVPETGELRHNFTDTTWNTRFLGDLYQDLSEEARKRYALLQTPEFVESFILDRTLEPAIETFGLKAVRLIDPTCGSGHFLLGAFQRLLDRWYRIEPGTVERELVQRALDAVVGVDVNPYAVAIARFRLLLAALQASGITQLREAPGFRIHVTAGDSLLHGRRFDELDLQGEMLRHHPVGMEHAYRVEDLAELNRLLGQQYHVVVGNPPYITVKDRGLNQAYRARYSTCHRQYSLGVPFTERFFDLAHNGDAAQPAGYVGMITANSFMKREFGKKLIEAFFPRIDLTHVIDTSGAYIPGHGTPTVILLGRHRRPVNREVRAVLGIRGEPSTPDEAAQGLVWRSIVDYLDQGNVQNEFISVVDMPRATFAKHPWSIGGGGAAELKEKIEADSQSLLSNIITEIGRTTHTGEDDAFYLPASVARTMNLSQFAVPLIIGEGVRDWQLNHELVTLFPYDQQTAEPRQINHGQWRRHFWVFRTKLKNRMDFGNYIEDRGLRWFDHSMFFPARFRTPLSIAFAFVATHNHFVLDRGGKVFKQSAPIIKLPSDATEDDHLALLGLLNSSTACFWMKQVFHNKGATSDKGVLQSDPEKFRYEFDGTKLSRFPIPKLTEQQRVALIKLTGYLDDSGRQLSAFSFGDLITSCLADSANLHNHIEYSIAERDNLRKKMTRWQEELDWLCYELYGLISSGSSARSRIWSQACEGMDPLSTDERPYRMLGQQTNASQLNSVDQSRNELINHDQHIGLIERPEYKRRWFRSAGAYDSNNLDDKTLLQRSIRLWLLDRLEIVPYWQEPHLQTTRSLANTAQLDADFMQVAELYRGHAGFDLSTLVVELVESEAVPFLSVLRYKPSGILKRKVWERTWELQRQEDAIDAEVETSLQKQQGEMDEQLQTRLAAEQRRRKQDDIGDIPPPPKYRSTDFLHTTCWRLRGALDVPKERFISYPFCSRDADPALLIGWAGWDPLQQAQALAAWYTEVVEQEGWPPERLKPLLLGLAELLPWLQQWHNDIDPEFNERMGDFFDIFLQGQLQQHGLTRNDLHTWQPPATSRRRGKRQRT